MSGSRLGRGRMGRLALLGCGAISVVFLFLLYRSTSLEMARLKDLHVKCALQQEHLAAQLQVVYEYRLQLEKTLSNEKSANAAAKEELQQKASRERTLRDKDSREAMQRFNALQQSCKILQTEHQDLKDDCKKKESVAFENSKKQETTLKELRIQLKKLNEEKESMDHLKNKYMEIVGEKEAIEEKYNSLKKSTENNNSDVERLQKQVIQLKRELDDAKKTPHFSIGGVKNEDSPVLPRHVKDGTIDNNNNNNNAENDKSAVLDNQMQVARPSSQQQVSRPSDELQGGQNPQPLQAPQNNRYLIDSDNNNINNNNNNNNDEKNVEIELNNNKNDDSLPNDQKSDIRFENRNGNIVPVGPNEQYAALPIPYQYQDKQQNEPQQQQQSPLIKMNEKSEQEDADQQKQVLAPPNEIEENLNMKKESPQSNNAQLSSKGPMMAPVLKPQAAAGQIDNEQNAVGDPNDFD